MNRLNWVWAIALGAALCAWEVSFAQDKKSAGPAAGKPDAKAGPKVAPVSVPISELNKEASESLKNGKWARDKSEFAKAVDYEVDRQKLAIAMLQRLHLKPEVDAYIKWQLLSFNPDFSVLRKDQMTRLIATMPAVSPHPKPRIEVPEQPNISMTFGQEVSRRVIGRNGTTRRVTGRPPALITNDATRLGNTTPTPTKDMAKRVEEANDRLDREMKAAEEANEMIFTYRDALSDIMPDKGAINLEILFADVKHRLLAGDVTALDRSLVLAEECKKMAGSPELGDEQKTSLIRGLRILVANQSIIVTGITYSNRQVGYKASLLRIPREDLLTIYSIVGNGEPLWGDQEPEPAPANKPSAKPKTTPEAKPADPKPAAPATPPGTTPTPAPGGTGS